ncbi:glycosyltransferase family 2 protein [Endobacterium cereale]|uniref:glycosyltransferase family 2 protein n=1 Tax=Endobacterium cereale TaxID=2663029 RepID=UPI002B487DDB|nr:glycosyltransferase family 2 protein [Endobacterium cereale]MEB2848283.1 glycosyltransferase family 2 protein [Endobacterium cereale]
MWPSNDVDHQLEDGRTVASTAQGDGRRRIGCVIVTYLPVHAPLLRQLEAIHGQVDHVIVVDNGDGSALPPLTDAFVLEIIRLGDNRGIAEAQNVGIRRARERGADHILLLDQDSLPAADMVARLIEALVELQVSGRAVAAVGPQYRDDRQGSVSPFVYRDGSALKERPTMPPQDAAVPADFLIASGCLIPTAIIGAVGDMDASLFIDYVDIEWALRAKHLGYDSYGIPAARMTHSLGDDWIVHRGRCYPVHSPLRHYYYARNALLLARRPWIGLPWRSILVRRVAKQLVFFSIVVPGQRLENFGMMMRGIWHGMIGRSGKS